MSDAWQPIETAPKGDDFVRILAAGPHRRADPRDPYVVDIIVWGFTYAFKEVEVGGGLYRKDRIKENAGWRRYGDHGEIPIDFEPLYWMPLPAPPMSASSVNDAVRAAFQGSQDKR